MGAWQPDISDSFFEASIFKLFINAGCWATWELKNDANLKSHSTPLHFVTTLCGIVVRPQFPVGGLSWELFIQLLTNIIGLFHLAMRDYGLAMVCTAQVPFLVNLDTLLRLVGSTEVRVSWPSAPMNYTVAAYKQLESLFLPSVYFVLHQTWDFLLPDE